MKLQAFGQTDVGKKRDHNEDAFLVDPELNLFAVADGMGGHAAGEVAAETAIETVKQEIIAQSDFVRAYRSEGPPEQREQMLKLIEGAIQKACTAVYKKAQEDNKCHNMGTTLSILLIADKGAFIAHVGDSRVYLLRESQVHQLTVDHTLVKEQIRRGVLSKNDAKKVNYTNVITRAVGIQEVVRVDTLHMEVLPSDRFLICSDGLHGYMRNEDILQVIQGTPSEKVPTYFIDLANSRGGKDNISAVFVDIASDEMESAKELRQRMEVLRNTPLFRHLNYRELVHLMNLTYTRSVKEQEMIIEEGDVGEELFLLVSGAASVRKGKQEIARLATGCHFGEMALIDDSPRSATIVSIEPSRLLVIGRPQFYDFIRRDPPAGIKLLWAFLQILSTRLRTTDEKLRELQEGLSFVDIKPTWIMTENEENENDNNSVGEDVDTED